ncbi:MAG: hypothetical protein JNK24_06135 [Alphaproteobacteria bacterium]|nr:hypothetical protein [Alphaproteobacteria bacterium]
MEKKTDMQALWERVAQEIKSGLKHGFFEFSIEGKVKDGKRHVTLHAGRKHKFTISPEDIEG